MGCAINERINEDFGAIGGGDEVLGGGCGGVRQAKVSHFDGERSELVEFGCDL